VFHKKKWDCEMHSTTVIGEPGVVIVAGGAVVQVTALSLKTDVNAVNIIVKPAKLTRWSAAEVE
jgi:hypothetical protein